MIQFQSQLKARADALDLSLAEVARRAGISERRIGHYASGRSEPDLQTLVRIAEVVGTTPDGLLLENTSSKKKVSKRDKLIAQIVAGCAVLNDTGLRLISGSISIFSKEKFLTSKSDS